MNTIPEIGQISAAWSKMARAAATPWNDFVRRDGRFERYLNESGAAEPLDQLLLLPAPLDERHEWFRQFVWENRNYRVRPDDPKDPSLMTIVARYLQQASHAHLDVRFANVDTLSRMVLSLGRRALAQPLPEQPSARLPYAICLPARLLGLDFVESLLDDAIDQESRLSSEARPSARRTANGHIRIVRSIFTPKNQALYRDLSLPALPDFMAAALLQEEPLERTAPELDKLATLIARMRSLRQSQTGQPVYAALLLGMHAGCRHSEARRARTDDLTDSMPGGRSLQILSGDRRCDQTKSRDRRVIIKDRVYAELLALGRNRQFIVAESERERVRAVCEAIRVLKECKLVEKADKPFQNLRRIFGTMTAHESGIERAKESLGHGDLRTYGTNYLLKGLTADHVALWNTDWSDSAKEARSPAGAESQPRA